MKILFFIITLITISINANDIIKEDNVYVLTDDNFDSFISSHDNVLVKFYAPWCGHCQKMAPEYSKAAYTLEKENLYLAQVDGTVNKQLVSKFEIMRYPTIKLFSKGNIINYKSARTEKVFINWMRKKTGPSTLLLNTEEEIEKVRKGGDICLVFFGDDKEALSNYEAVAQNNDEYQFITCNNEKLYETYQIKKDTLVLFKHFEDGKSILTDNFSKDNIENFIATFSSPLVMSFNEKAAQTIFTNHKPGLIIYRDINSDTKDYESLMREVAIHLGGKIQAVVTGINGKLEKTLAEYTNVVKSDLPTVRIADTTKELKKYIMHSEINKENILQFVKDWQEKKIKPYYKSEEIPFEQKGNVYTIVGKTFQQNIIDNDKDVLVKFYSPSCAHCKKLAPVYEELAKKYKSNSKLLIAEFDGTKNEAEDIHIKGYPPIRFWPAGKKRTPIDFSGERTLKNLEDFIKKHATNPLNVIENKEDLEKSDL